MRAFLKTFFGAHPRLVSWLILSVGMVALFLVAARGHGLTPGQLVALSALCVAVAGLCAWIIGWDTE